MFSQLQRTALIALIVGALGLPGRAAADAYVFADAGGDPASIQQTVDDFRDSLGTLNPNVAGSFPDGRREINWDGVPDGFAAPNNLPADFFNVNSPRGVVFSTSGQGFRVSANASNPDSNPVRFGEINSTYPDLFQTFSPQKLFTPLGGNDTAVNFFVPGATDPATVSGFGAVFANVRLDNTTSITFYDDQGYSVGTYYAPSAGTGGLSFLGVYFSYELVSAVEIITGTTALGPNDYGDTNVVVMDDFIFGEPRGY